MKWTIKWDMTIKLCPASILLYAILPAIASIPVCTAITVYVRPDNDHTHCPGEPCNPLSYYEQPNTRYFAWASDTMMVFLNGVHYASRQMIIKNIENFTMVGSGGFTLGLEDLPEASSKIECVGTHRSGFNFINVTGLHIENLTFTYCGQEVVLTVRAVLAFAVAYNVNISRVTVRNSSGFGLYADKVFGSVWVYESAFLYNTGSKEYYGGNARFWYGECPEDHSTYMQIESSYFLHGYDTLKLYNSFNVPATGLAVLILNCPLITLRINNITALGNKGGNGGNLGVNLISNLCSDKMPSVIINNSRIASGAGRWGGGLSIYLFMSNPKEKKLCNQVDIQDILRISNTQFFGNHASSKGGALYIISYHEAKHGVTRPLSLQTCTFSGNSVSASGEGAAMEVAQVKVGYTPYVSAQFGFELAIQNCSFYNNSLLHNKNDSLIGATVNFFSMGRVAFKHCNFTKNTNTALSLVDSNLILEGNILFDGNHAINGGALRFSDTSFVYIRNNTHIKFYNNHAKNAGGAIYVQQQWMEVIRPCFFQPDIPDFTNITDLKKWMSLTFVNNTAKYAGSVLYGGRVDYCYTYVQFTHHKPSSYYYSSRIFNIIFDIRQQLGNSLVSSDPFVVCLCNESGYHRCNIKNYTFPRSVYPGESFNVSAVAVGQRSGVAPAPILATVTNSHNQSLFEPIEQNQNANNHCATLTYTLHSRNQQETLELTVKPYRAISFYHGYLPPKITVKLHHPCPWGFTLQHGPPYCDCDPLLVRHKMSCNINKQTIYRVPPLWIGYYNRKRNSNLSARYCKNCSLLALETMCTNIEELGQDSCQGVVIHPECPYDYCIIKGMDISVDSTDNQCAFHRTGTLCGRCQDGFSLMLGIESTKCIPCSNIYLLLLIVFLLVGLVLVFFLTAFNLTVSEGRIIGLIFYTNVVHINRTIFFPPIKANPLAVFIAWLNLDLGIETCFYSGLDAYARAWLQFAFPIYIWLIAGLTILLSRRYTIAARLCGRNAVKVLATLFLLSVAKLVRAIIPVLTYTVIDYPDGSHVSVWLPDANVKFLQGKHIPLFITAVTFWALILCFVLVLMFIPCLQKKSHTPLLFWVNKLKPLFDAYTGPYKDRYRFWPGLLLFLLSILVFIFQTLNDFGLDKPNLKLMFTAISCILVLALAWVFRGVYRKWPLDIIESFCILNLGLLAVVTRYILTDSNSQEVQVAVVNVSAGTVALLVITVLGCQAYKKLTTSTFCHAFALSLALFRRESEREQCLEEPIQYQTDELNPEPVLQEVNNVTEPLLPPVIHFDQYREPVLEYEDENM